MSSKTRCEVVINGTTYTLVGTETGEYMQAIASYINDKINKIKEKMNSQYMDNQMLVTLAALNVADELHKKNREFRELVMICEEQEATIAEYGQDLTKAQQEIDELYKKISDLQLELFRTRKELSEFIDAFDQKLG